MKYKIYRGTKLNEAIKTLEKEIKNKYLYWITDIKEAEGYAEVAKYEDRSVKGALVEAEIDLDFDEIRNIDYKEYPNLWRNKSKRCKNNVGIYKTGGFDVLLVPPSMISKIQNPKIVNII